MSTAFMPLHGEVLACLPTMRSMSTGALARALFDAFCQELTDPHAAEERLDVPEIGSHMGTIYVRRLASPAEA
jgi:hypothetical protein